MTQKKSEQRLNFGLMLAGLFVGLIVAGCSDDSGSDAPAAPKEDPAQSAPPAEPSQPAETPVADSQPIEAKETRWKIAVIAAVDGELGVLGEGTLTEDPEGNPTALGIEYYLDDASSRVVISMGRSYIGIPDGNSRWLDITDQVGQVSHFVPKQLRQEDAEYKPLREQSYEGEAFTIFGKIGEVTAVGENAAIASRYLYWQDNSGTIRRHASIVNLRIEGKSIALITMADLDDDAALPDWYHSAAFDARFNAIPAAPALRFGAGQTQASIRLHEHPSMLGSALGFFVPDASAQDWGEILGGMGDQALDDIFGDTMEDYIENFPGPGANLSDHLTQMGRSAYRTIKNYLTPEQLAELGKAAIKDAIKKIVERSILQMAPYLGYYGLAAFLAAEIVDGAIDFLLSLVHGEPHIRTFDDRGYSFQAAGEFVYFKTPGFEVQQRFLGTVGRATSAQATAVRVGGHVIETYFERPAERDQVMRILLDGDEVELDRAGISFDDGGFVGRLTSDSRRHNLIAVAPDGSYAIVENLNVSQNVIFGITEDIRQQVRGGLGGVPDGNRANDFTLRDGTLMSADEAGTIEGLYGRFAMSWRVTPEERLFTRGTADEFLTPEFTDTPAAIARLEDFSQAERDRAELVCTEAGVQGEAALKSCTYDVLVTGDPAWAQAAGASQVVQSMLKPEEARPAVSSVRRFDAPASIPAGETLRFAWRGPGAKDDMIYISSLTMADARYPLRNRHDATDPSDAVLIAPAVPGDYEIRYMSYANGAVLFRQSIEIEVPEVVIDVPAEVNAGMPLAIPWSGPAATDDGLFVARPDMDASRYWMGDLYHDVEDGSPAELVAPAQPGDYEIRYYSQANGLPLVRKAFKVLPHAVVIDAPETVAAGAEFEFSWQGPAAEGDFLFVAPPDMDANRYYTRGRHYASAGSTGMFVAPAKPGNYEIRYYSSRNATTLAERTLTVQ